MKRKYKKDVTIEYHYQDAPESEIALEEAFDSIFTGMIQGQKKLKAYFKSDEYRRIYQNLSEQKSLLAEFLPGH
ncbi:MAG: hypothetical protein UT84_C0015G0007 [Candidatus Curtissbacteria bacterium GW2011_GWA1_40_16]|uniref:Uncharacterized protein n=1 Tax=Candidatus Curtissbacteria bacterium GW2011_GWA1_40_16 TaxID=1618405 RepID=A0A0G0RBF0_9BACT|nr:MAG: hypothetical protein UT84_C0015G0007 [Candidatus Curtissbacteria bacterium GW2011_GWA1_40_16]